MNVIIETIFESWLLPVKMLANPRLLKGSYWMETGEEPLQCSVMESEGCRITRV